MSLVFDAEAQSVPASQTAEVVNEGSAAASADGSNRVRCLSRAWNCVRLGKSTTTWKAT
jgi:hypothetical protein